MMLTDIKRASGSVLMTFWKIFDSRMKISWNFEIFSSGRRYYCEKSSEVTQRRFNIPLTTYFGFVTFWWVFTDISSFSWPMQCKRDFFLFGIFFLQKEKFIGLPGEFQRLIFKIFARFGYRGISPCSGK